MPEEDKAELTDTAAMASSPTSPATPKRSVGSCVGAHFKKWWWVHVIVVIAVVLVVVLPVVYVAYPKMAQDEITKSTLNITSMAITDPTPTSFRLKQSSILGSSSSVHPIVYGFLASVTLFLPGGKSAPFGNVNVPTTKAADGAQLDVDEVIDLGGDASRFGDFAEAVLGSEKFELNVFGETKLRLGGLPKVDVTYNKTLDMRGLNQLKGFDITSFSLLPETEPDGTNTKGTVYIPNPSVFSITMGNITLDLTSNKTHIGQSTLPNLTLHPGNNTLPMTAQIDKMAVFDHLNPNGTLSVDIRGNSSVYHGRELPYFSEALQGNIIRAELDLGKLMG